MSTTDSATAGDGGNVLTLPNSFQSASWISGSPLFAVMFSRQNVYVAGAASW